MENIHNESNNGHKSPEMCRICGDFLQSKSKLIGENIIYCMAGHEAYDILRGLYIGENLIKDKND